MKICIKNGHVIDPKNNIDAKQDLYIDAGQIASIGEAPKNFMANETIDASGLIVTPGFVDISARLREPGNEYKATLESELSAAAAGGSQPLSRGSSFSPSTHNRFGFRLNDEDGKPRKQIIKIL